MAVAPGAAPSRRGRRAVATARASGAATARWIARQELIVLVTALVIVIALIGFIKIAEETAEGDLREFDDRILRALRDPVTPDIPVGPPWLVEAGKDITALGGRTLLMITILTVMGALALERKLHAMWLVGIAALGGGVLTTAMKELFARARPDAVPHLVPVLSPSFPSGHSMLAAVIYLTLGALLASFHSRRSTKAYLMGVAMFMTFVVGVSRVYLGVHYPTDVLAGWCAGLVWALVCWLVARYLQERGAVEPPTPPP